MAEEPKTGCWVGVCILFIIGMPKIIWCTSLKDSACEKNSQLIQKECFSYSPPKNAKLRQSSFYDEILDRCSKYDTTSDAPLSVDKDCKKIAEAFRKAVAFKDPCHIRAEDYEPLMQLVNQEIPKDKVLLWSKTEELKKHYMDAGGELRTLDKMFVGHIAVNLTWCGSKSSKEVKYGLYKEESGICPEYPSHVFWNVASEWFAKNVRGKVRVLLSVSNKESVAYNKTSIFACAEVPNLSSEVHALRACVIQDQNYVSDSCFDSSIKELNLTLKEKNITFSCVNGTRDTVRQCVENRGVSQCKSVLWDSGMIGLIIALLLSINMPDLGETLVGS